MKSLIFVVVLLALINLVAAQIYEDSDRENICERNAQECIQACYCQEKGKPSVNKCDPKTFNYECTCAKGYKPPVSNTTFQAYFAACNIDHNNCRDKCNGEPTCAQECQKKYNCLPSSDSDKGCKANGNSSTTQISQAAETSSTSRKLYENTSSAYGISPSAYSFMILAVGIAMAFMSV